MKLKKEQYWKLSYLQKEAEYKAALEDMCQKDKTISGLRRRIHELESALISNKIPILKANARRAKDELNEYRSELAKGLGIDSLDSYLIDTDTLELKHETEV